MMDKDNVKVEGHRGTWYVVDELIIVGGRYYLLEHNTYGEDAPWIAIDVNGTVILDDITEGKGELLDYLQQSMNR